MCVCKAKATKQRAAFNGMSGGTKIDPSPAAKLPGRFVRSGGKNKAFRLPEFLLPVTALPRTEKGFSIRNSFVLRPSEMPHRGAVVRLLLLLGPGEG